MQNRSGQAQNHRRHHDVEWSKMIFSDERFFLNEPDGLSFNFHEILNEKLVILFLQLRFSVIVWTAFASDRRSAVAVLRSKQNPTTTASFWKTIDIDRWKIMCRRTLE